MKKLLTSLATLAIMVVCFVILPTEVQAADGTGRVGDCTWVREGTTVTISGNGRMGSEGSGSLQPWGQDITHVIIEEGVTHISQDAFKMCPLEYVSIASTVRSIGFDAFKLSGLTSIIIPEGVTSIGEGAFTACRSLEYIKLPSTLTTIGRWGFSECNKLKSIVLPAGVTKIDSYAFNYCRIENVWYLGSESDKARLSIGGDNLCLNTATWHYNSCPVGAPHAYNGVCDNSCNGCGEIREVPDHSYDSACDNSCNGCGELRTVPDHIYINACDNECNVCGGVRNVSHQHSTEWYMAQVNHWHECDICGDKKDFGPHNFANACDTDCNTCGFVRVVTHDYQSILSKDNATHWHECSICGNKKDLAAHIPGAEATEATAQTCTTCGYIIKPTLNHTHKYSDVLTSNREGHWYTCSGCSEQKDYAAHVYANTCDTDCNTCGFVRVVTHDYQSTWSKDGTNHWIECAVCKEKKDLSAHTPGADATETTPQICTTCSYVIKPALNHTHNFATEWTTDDTGHWHTCPGCEEKDSYITHTWENGLCTVCGTTDPNSIQPTTAPTDGQDSTTPPTEQPNDNKTEEKGNNIIWIIIVIVVLAGAAVVVFIVLKKKGLISK